MQRYNWAFSLTRPIISKYSIPAVGQPYECACAVCSSSTGRQNYITMSMWLVPKNPPLAPTSG